MPVPGAMAGAASFGQALGQSSASTGVTGLISGALGQLFGGMNARRQWKYAKKQMALQQQYALEQMQKQSELSYSNWQKQFDYENDYNNPTKVFERYLAAGVTPAAVLGSSGVGVNATMSGGSAGMPSASGPSGGAPVAPGPAFSGDPTAIAQNLVAKSTADRNAAAAARDRADANRIANETHEAGFQRLYDDATLALMRAKEKGELADAEYISTQNALLGFDKIVREWTLGGQIEAVLAEYQDKINVAKAGNIRNEYLRTQLESELLLTWSMYQSNTADAAYKQQLSNLTYTQIIDLRNEIQNNWDKRWRLTEPDGSSKTYSLKDLYGMLTLADVEAAAWKPVIAEQEARGKQAEAVNTENRWKWEALHAITNIISALAIRRGISSAGESIGSATEGAGRTVRGKTLETRENYDAKGKRIGGTIVTREQLEPDRTAKWSTTRKK